MYFDCFLRFFFWTLNFVTLNCAWFFNVIGFKNLWSEQKKKGKGNYVCLSTVGVSETYVCVCLFGLAKIWSKILDMYLSLLRFICGSFDNIMGTF